jgi:hypothetical protein
VMRVQARGAADEGNQGQGQPQRQGTHAEG